MRTFLIYCFLIIKLAQPSFSQYDTTISDLDIALKLINQPAEKLTSIIRDLDFETYITFSGDTRIQFYLQRGDISVRCFVLKVENLYKGSDPEKIIVAENICREVFVRYYHDNINDLSDFYSYEIPESTKFVTYEKSLGEQKSHLRILMNNH